MPFRSEFKKQLATLIISAFGFAAALAWNTAIQSWLSSQPLLSAGGPFMYAVAVTVIAVIVAVWVSRFKEGKVA